MTKRIEIFCIELFTLHWLIYATIHDLFLRAHTHIHPSISISILQIKSLIKRDKRIVSFSLSIASGD